MILVCALLYLAIVYIRPGEIVPALIGLPILKYVALGAAFAAVLSLLLKPRSFWDRAQDKFFLLYWFAILASNPAWGWLAGGLFALDDFAPVVFFYCLIRIGVPSVSDVNWFIRTFVCLNLFLAVNGLLQIYTGIGFGGGAALETATGLRIQGTGIFNDPNDLGMTLVMTVPMVLMVALGSGQRLLSRLFAVASLGIIMAACYYTNSRGTMVGLGGVFAARVYRRFGIVPASVLAAVGLMAIVALGPSRMSTISAEDESAQGRIQAWAAGMQMFKSSPVLGIGYHRFADLHEMVAHNSFVHVLGELGIIGAIGFVGVFYAHFRGLRVTAAQPVGDELRRRIIGNALVDSAIGLLICTSFLSRQYVSVTFLIPALGASFANATAQGELAERESAWAELPRVLVLTVTLTTIFYVIARLFASYS